MLLALILYTRKENDKIPGEATIFIQFKSYRYYFVSDFFIIIICIFLRRRVYADFNNLKNLISFIYFLINFFQLYLQEKTQISKDIFIKSFQISYLVCYVSSLQILKKYQQKYKRELKIHKFNNKKNQELKRQHLNIKKAIVSQGSWKNCFLAYVGFVDKISLKFRTGLEAVTG